MKPISSAQNTRYFQRDGEILICNNNPFKHGLFFNALIRSSKELCVISLPRGLYQYNMLPVGIKPVTDIFQQRMEALLFYMPVIIIYMDVTIVFGYVNFRLHLVYVSEVLRRLEEAFQHRSCLSLTAKMIG